MPPPSLLMVIHLRVFLVFYLVFWVPKNRIGSDIMMQLDDVVSSVSTDQARFAEANDRTLRWLDRCIKVRFHTSTTVDSNCIWSIVITTWPVWRSSDIKKMRFDHCTKKNSVGGKKVLELSRFNHGILHRKALGSACPWIMLKAYNFLIFGTRPTKSLNLKIFLALYKEGWIVLQEA